MYVCMCKAITKSDLEHAVENGMSYQDIRQQTGATTDCGSCAGCVKSIVQEAQASNRMLDFNLAKAV